MDILRGTITWERWPIGVLWFATFLVFSTVRLGLGGCRVELTVGSVVSGYINQECLIGFYWVLFVFRFMVVH